MIRLGTVWYGMWMLLVTAVHLQADVLHTTWDQGLTVTIKEHHARPVVSVQVAELERAKPLAVMATQFDAQTNEQRASIAALDVLYGMGIGFRERDAEQLANVTKADVQQVANLYLNHPTIAMTPPNP